MKVARYAAVAAAMVVGTVTAQAQVVGSPTAVDCTGSSSAQVAGCTVSNTVTSAVPFVARMSLNVGSTALTAPAATDFGTTAGVNTVNGPLLTVSSNTGYTITVVAPAPMFTGGSNSKPAGNLTFNVNGSNTYLPVTGTGSALATALGATASTAYQIGYNTIYNWTIDTPGSYQLGLNYTLTAP